MEGKLPDYHAPLVPDNYYHIFNRGNNKENLFSNDGNYLFFLNKLKKYILPHLKIFSYCLMPNHFHFLAQVRDQEQIIENLTKLQKFSKVEVDKDNLDINKFLEERFQRFFASYALAFNKQQNRSGSLFQKRFKRIHVHSDGYLLKLLHYIHNNPIHHKFCKNYHDWEYSSYPIFLSSKTTNVERDEVLGWLGDIDEFIEFHKVMIDYGEIKDLLFDHE